MTHEFKVKQFKDATVYTLESASSGGTSSGMVATVSKPLGKDQLVMQSRTGPKETPKPRNFVAKNAKMGGAGQHKDKKKAEKQGDVKHRKPFAEGGAQQAAIAIAKKKSGKYDKEGKRLKEAFENDESNIMYRYNPDTGRLGQRMIHNNEEQVAHRQGYRDSHEAALKVHGIIKSKFDPKKFMQNQNGKWVQVFPYGEQGVAEDHSTATGGWGAETGSAGRAGTGYAGNVRENPDWYNDEANGMTTSQLKSLVKHAAKLRHAVKSMGSDTLEPWQQAKITKAADYLDAVFDAVDDDYDMGESNHPDEKEDKALIRKMVKQQALKQERMAEEAKHGLYYNVNKRKKAGTSRSASSPKAPTAQAWKDAAKTAKSEGVAEGLNEFAPGNGGGESGRWYTDDQMTDLVGDGWWQDMDVSGANIGVPDGDIPKKYMIRQAQAWLDDQGYNVQVLNCKLNDDDMEWYIEGSFQNSRFAKKGVAEGMDDAYMSELHAKLAEKIPKNAPVKTYIDDFSKAAKTPNAKGHHQFKNKSPEKVRQMAIAASYGAKNPSKKKKK